MTNEINIIESLGYVLKESVPGKNEFRSWTTYHYVHPNGRTLLYNDSDEILIVRNPNRRIVLEGRFRLNIERLKNL